MSPLSKLTTLLAICAAISFESVVGQTAAPSENCASVGSECKVNDECCSGWCNPGIYWCTDPNSLDADDETVADIDTPELEIVQE